MKWIACFISYMALLLSMQVHSQLRYVAPSGDDGNNGSFYSPFRTLQKAVDAADPGDTIIVRDGVYGPEGAGHHSMTVNINKAGTASKWITLKAEHKWKAILDCQLIAHSYINFKERSAFWRVEDFDIEHGYSSGFWANSGGAKNIIIKGNHIHHIGNRVDTIE